MNKVKNNTEEPKAAPLYQNHVRLVGFLGGDPVHHENRTVFSLATRTSWQAKDSDEWQHHTEWHRIIVWDKLAGGVGSLVKGDYVLVEGELRSNFYQKQLSVGVDTVSVPTTSWEIRARDCTGR